MGERIWSAIGKISLVVAVLVGGATLWEKVIAPRERLTAELRTSSFKVPTQMLEEIATKIDDVQETLVADLKSRNAVDLQKANKDVNELFGDPQYLSKRVIEVPGRESPPLSSPFELDMFDPDTLAELVVRNTGTKKLSEATLLISDWQYAHVILSDGSNQWLATELGRESQPLKIGDLSPGAVTGVSLWGRKRWRTGDIQLSHANGLGEVKELPVH
jgi:hypothetical protein